MEQNLTVFEPTTREAQGFSVSTQVVGAWRGGSRTHHWKIWSTDPDFLADLGIVPKQAVFLLTLDTPF